MTSCTVRRTVAASATLVVAGTLGLAAGDPAAHAATLHPGVAHASAKATSKKFTFVTAGSELKGKASQQVGIFHGAINGGGKDVPLAESDVVHLSGGNINVKHPDAGTTFTPKVDKSTCYIIFTTTGKFTLTKGTGKYRGVTGSGSYVGHGYGYTSRKKDGSCNMNAAPLSEVFEISAKGTLG